MTTPDPVREAFEKWAESVANLVTTGRVTAVSAPFYFTVWKAAWAAAEAALSAPPPQVPEADILMGMAESYDLDDGDDVLAFARQIWEMACFAVTQKTEQICETLKRLADEYAEARASAARSVYGSPLYDPTISERARERLHAAIDALAARSSAL